MRRKGQQGPSTDHEKDARALVFMLERIKGRTLAQIADAYGVHLNTVQNYLKRARERNLVVDEARTLIARNLLPLALAVVEAHLHAGSLEAARDVIFGLGVLSKNSVVKHETQDADDSLDNFRQKFFEAKVVVANATAKDGEVAELPQHEPKQLPSGRLGQPDDQNDQTAERTVPGFDTDALRAADDDGEE